MILDNISTPRDIKNLKKPELDMLVSELREIVISTVAKTGGHLASNLGVVELTVALHRVFNSPEDKIIWDVGHQSYIHKLLTGRKDRMSSLRQYNGLCGFTMRAESEHDPFGSGHSSTSISAAVGIAAANKLDGNENYTIAVVGDGAFTGGMIYEALNNCAEAERLIIILNDNEMSISPNVGGMSRYFSRFRNTKRYFSIKHFFKRFFGAIPFVGGRLVDAARRFKNRIARFLLRENFFELLGLTYYGPLDGNNESQLELVLNEAKNNKKCSVVHIYTKKGKGYSFAEEKPGLFHSVGGFDIASGEIKNGHRKTFSDYFGELLTEAGKRNEDICAVTAAMCSGTGLDMFSEYFPHRFFDVGIAEPHALTFSAGLASQGKKAVFAVYSTFFQRAYDQFLHDAALQKLPIMLALDRAGFVGEDGATHHGVFDVAIINSIPYTEIYSPECFEDMKYSFDRALESRRCVSVRYPKGSPEEYDRTIFKKTGDLFYCDFGSEPSVFIITYGRITKNALLAASNLNEHGVSTRVVKLVCIKPIDFDVLTELGMGTRCIYVLEEGIKTGGVGEVIIGRFCETGFTNGKKVKIRAIDDVFVPHGSNTYLYRECGFMPEQIAAEILEMTNDESAS
ncbi:MAG: 1-deoxy-D-xylulose-5-phosphate synthase [Eubacteriales bacterium]|nr:1-deoxy-D-xylulose-5-phosphate synthase [Eubacteriales bacterium]MDD4422348.1 1-deoxy-D-xylulose-5-phosphate synthase [Eubacteriales bacterium]HBR31185.1 1-deoxy-D-xylulose-5-phosphate synthase [Clostridiales bacterium]